MKKPYRVRVDGEVMQVWRKAGEIIHLTDDEAKHLAPPNGRSVIPVTVDAPAAASAPAPKARTKS